VRGYLEKNGVPVRVTLEKGLPLYRIREVNRFFAALKAREKELCRASQLFEHLSGGQPRDAASPWTQMLQSLLALYREETADTELPACLCLEWFYEAICEQRREKMMGQGVHLGTVHSAKGLEFDHVFILDGDWRWPAEKKMQEDERRLLYVGMTRARETLSLLEMEARGNPFISHLQGDFIFKKELPVDRNRCLDGGCRRYRLVDLSELYVSYAGRFPERHPIHERLARLEAGDLLQLIENRSDLDLTTADGYRVARLSAKGCARLSGNIRDIVQARVIGMVQWSADRSEQEYRIHLKTDAWEVPLVELALDGGQAPCAAFS
jgi:ATP-dependent DNA helicase RecQ